MNDPDFDQFLKTASAVPPLPTAFKREVWHRIQSRELESPRGIARWQVLAARFTRPWGAAAGVVAMVALGLWLGSVSLPDPEYTKNAYAMSISPFTHADRK